MSIRAYRLLRNNKEEGPFTAEEIIQKSLKPFDLIWVDGRSAAWNYPGELAEFKKYVPEETATSKEINKPVSSSVHAAIAMNNAIIQPETKQQKPRYKVSAAWSKIQTTTASNYNDAIIAEPKKPSYKKIVEAEPSTSDAKSLSWKEAWLDWEKEKVITPVAAVKSSIPSKPTSINQKHVEPTLETKYSEPLDAIKDRYIDNLIQQKQKSKRFAFGKASEFIIPSLALIIIFSVGYWLLHTTNNTASALTSAPVKTEQPTKVENTNTVPENTVSPSTTSNGEENSLNTSQDVNNVSAPVLSDQAENRKTNFANTVKVITPKENKSSAQSTAPGIKSTSQKTENNTKQFDASVINNVPSDNVYNDPSKTNTGDLNAQDARPVKRRTDDVANNPSSTPKKESTPFKKVNTKSSANYVTVPEYAEMNNGSADLKIQNISDVNLDLVVVDVQYFDASSRFRKGETLYLHNLKAGKTVVVKTPKDINSQYATSKISLVSSDANNVYVIGEN